MFFVLGIDAATWTVISPNLNLLPAFKKLCEVGHGRELLLREKPISPAVWCGMFCGLEPQEHGHDSFVSGDRLIKREDIRLDFIWDILHREGKKVRVLNVPFIVPPYSFNVDFRPVGFGLPTNEKEWHEELDRVTAKAEELMSEGPDLLVVCYTLLDRVQHFHWGEPCVLDWYRRLDEKIGRLLIESGFLKGEENKLIVISDHGFCSFGEARVQTLPLRSEYGELKGDHHEAALLITVNVEHPIARPQDIFFAIREAVK